MKNKKLKNGIEEIKKITMTDAEKKHVFENVINFSIKPKTPVLSPLSFYSFLSGINKTRVGYYIVIPLVFILSGGGVVFASQDSLPDSIFYPIKVKIIEPVEGIFIFSQKSKAKYQSSLAKQRLLEAEILASQGRLDASMEKKISDLLSSHTLALNDAIEKADESSSKEELDDITTNFRAEMNARARILDAITKHEENKTEDNKKEDLIEDNKIKDKEIHLSENARKSAEKIKDTLNKKETKSINNFVNKKEKVKALIEEVGISDIKLKNEFKYKDDEEGGTQKKIDEAKKHLEEAEKEDRDGHSNEAHSSLLDSESLIKEANILIKEEAKN